MRQVFVSYRDATFRVRTNCRVGFGRVHGHYVSRADQYRKRARRTYARHGGCCRADHALASVLRFCGGA